MEEKHLPKKWEISTNECQAETGCQWKVTIRLPELSAAETKVFSSKKRQLSNTKNLQS